MLEDNVQNDIITICVNCVKDKDLEILISKTGKQIDTCIVCGSNNVIAIEYREGEEFYHAVRSLIRFSYSEMEGYNTHWGGTKPEELLREEKLFFSDLFYGNEDFSQEIIESIVYEAYYEANKGVSLYYGYWNGEPAGFYYKIQKDNTRLIQKAKCAIKNGDYNTLYNEVIDIVSFCEKIFTTDVEGLCLTRARIGVKKMGTDISSEIFGDLKCIPYTKEEIGAPPFDRAEMGRMNRMGFSFLYLAEDLETAIVEVRPAPGDFVSIGIFEQQHKLKIIDFTQLTIRDYWKTDDDLETFRDLYGLVSYISSHVGTNGKHNYLFTQLMAEELIRRGYKGIRHASSFTGNSNFVIFEPSAFKNDPEKGSVMEIQGINFKFTKRELLNEEYIISE